MGTSDDAKKKEITYKLNCSVCNEDTDFKVVLVSRKSGAKLECLKCGKTIRKNIKYLQNKKNGN